MIRFNQTIGRKKYLSPEEYLDHPEIESLLKYLHERAARAEKNGTKRGCVNCMLIELMLLTGLRCQEVCELKLRDLPTHHKKNVILVRSGKGDVMRTIVVMKELKNMLEKYIQQCRKGARPGSPVFVNESGQRLLKKVSIRQHKLIVNRIITSELSKDSLYRKVKRIGKKVGLNLHPHILRHTYCTHLYSKKKDLRFCQEQLGHSRPETTAIYAGVLDRDKQDQVDNLYNYIWIT